MTATSTTPHRPVVILGEPIDNPGPPIMTAVAPLVARVRADVLPECCRVPRVLAYHPDPDGDGWFTALTLRPWMPPGYRARSRVLTRAQAQRAIGCPLATYPRTDYTVAHLQAPRRRCVPTNGSRSTGSRRGISSGARRSARSWDPYPWVVGRIARWWTARRWTARRGGSVDAGGGQCGRRPECEHVWVRRWTLIAPRRPHLAQWDCERCGAMTVEEFRCR
ncbi:MAG: hypothetical protein ACRDS0_41655 [Pseudonocardiaceae bacterium]